MGFGLSSLLSKHVGIRWQRCRIVFGRPLRFPLEVPFVFPTMAPLVLKKGGAVYRENVYVCRLASEVENLDVHNGCDHNFAVT
jgi:hypothetical protein